MLIAACLVGYVASAAVFYLLAARSAMKVEEANAFGPMRAALTVVEGGNRQADDVRKAA